MFTLEFVCKRNAERSVIAHAVAQDYLRREGMDGSIHAISSGVIAQEHPSPFGRLEHAVVNHFRGPALARYGLSYDAPPRLTRPQPDVDLVLAFEPWIADRCVQRYAPLKNNEALYATLAALDGADPREARQKPEITTIQEYAGRELPSIRGIRKYRRYCSLIEAVDETMPVIVRRILTEHPERF